MSFTEQSSREKRYSFSDDDLPLNEVFLFLADATVPAAGGTSASSSKAFEVVSLSALFWWYWKDWDYCAGCCLS